MNFLGENYLLENDIALDLYSQVKDLPVIDPHNHGDVREIVENKNWHDIWQVEAETDHYVWQLMRRRGVPEEKITGKASNKEKWLALAEIFPQLAVNPTYEWIHLDLKRRFGIERPVSKKTADYIWEKTKEKLKEEEMKPVKLLKKMNVEIMCTTDEPESLLKYHKKARKDIKDIKILPTWRPDKYMKIESKEWKNNVIELGRVYNQNISNFNDLLEVFQKSHDFFEKMGCVSSDHGMLEPVSYPVKKEKVSAIFRKAFTGKQLTEKEINDYKSYMFIFSGKMNQEKDWVTQLHIGPVRNYRDRLYNSLGKDSGGDISTNNLEIVDNLKYYLNQFDNKLKIVIYYLDPVIESSLGTICRAFPNVYAGAPWWFNDNPYGIEEQLNYFSSVDLLSCHAGMVSDSRKVLSYGSRHEMFRRVLCNLLGKKVDRGQIPVDIASDLAKSASYEHPFNLYFQ